MVCGRTHSLNALLCSSNDRTATINNLSLDHLRWHRRITQCLLITKLEVFPKYFCRRNREGIPEAQRDLIGPERQDHGRD